MHMAVKLEDETKIKASLKQEGMQERPLWFLRHHWQQEQLLSRILWRQSKQATGNKELHKWCHETYQCTCKANRLVAEMSVANHTTIAPAYSLIICCRALNLCVLLPATDS
jgi:hypothetical protein